MPTVLSSWKEIAKYLDKGVRTVQRWEKSLGLPVRRPSQNTAGIVVAITDELDEWMHSTFVARCNEPNTGLAALRQQNRDLRHEVESLRAEIQRLNHAPQLASRRASAGKRS